MQRVDPIVGTLLSPGIAYRVVKRVQKLLLLNIKCRQLLRIRFGAHLLLDLTELGHSVLDRLGQVLTVEIAVSFVDKGTVLLALFDLEIDTHRPADRIVGLLPVSQDLFIVGGDRDVAPSSRGIPDQDAAALV